MIIRNSLPTLAALSIAVGVVACSSSGKTGGKAQDTVTTASGLKYIRLEPGDGMPVAPGMKLQVDYAGYLENGKIFDTSIEEVGRANDFDRGGYPFEPIEFTVGKGQVIKGWDEGLTTDMRVGERRRLIIPPDLAYGSRQNGDIPPNSTLIFDIHLLSAGQGAPIAKDTVTTMSGLRYIELEKGTGTEVQRGMKVTVDYAGYLEDGRIFDTSIKEVGDKNNFDRGGYPFEPIEFTVGKGQVIRGWDEGLTTGMRVGGRRRLIIPPDLGYGAQGSGMIPPNATLIFDVHVLAAE